nr:YdcF family protein [uncultured Anaeromusa sp.]
MKTYKKITCLLGTTVLLLFLGSEALVLKDAFTAAPAPSQVILILGTRVYGQEPGPMLQLRLEKALALYRQGYAPYLLASGGQGSDEGISEAAAMRNYLVARGVPTTAIILEDSSTSTYENLGNSAAILREKDFNQVIVVTNRSHLFRSLYLARLHGLNASGAAAPMSDRLGATVYQFARESAAVLSLMQYERSPSPTPSPTPPATGALLQSKSALLL